MQCPSCKFTADFLVNCKFCPQCASSLPHAQNIPRKEHGSAPLTTVQQSDDPTGNRDQAERNGQSRGAPTPPDAQTVDSKEKPGDTDPTGTQEEKQQQGYEDKVYERPAESKNSQNTMMTPPDESPAAAETVRGPAELVEGEFDDAETRNDDGASIRTKEVTQSKKPSAHGQVTSANQQQKGKQKEADKKADGAKTGKEQRFTPTGQPTSSKNANANPQKTKEVSPYNSTTQKGAGNKSAPAKGKKDANVPTKTSQSSKSGSQNLNRGKVDTTTLVKSPAEGKDPLSDTGKISDDKGSAKAHGKKDAKVPSKTSQSSKSETLNLNGGKVETTTLVKSPAEGKEVVLRDPLSETGNISDDKESAKTSRSQTGHWYQKNKSQPQTDTAATQKNVKGRSKEEKNSTAGNPPVTNSSLHISSMKQVEPEDGVTVVFHVLLVSNFKMEEERLHIRANGEDLGNFKLNCVDMELIRSDKGKDKKKLMRFFGRCTLSISRAQKGTSYKYVIIKKGEILWEQLVEFQPRYPGVIVDRFLSIPDKYLKRGGK